MKKNISRIVFLLVVLFLPLLAMGCPQSYVGIATVTLEGTFVLDGENLSCDVYDGHISSQEPVRTPYIFAYYPTVKEDSNTSYGMTTKKIDGNKYEITISSTAIMKEPDSIDNAEYLNSVLLKFSYVPSVGDVVTVSSENITWTEKEKYAFTVDFTNGTFTVE